SLRDHFGKAVVWYQLDNRQTTATKEPVQAYALEAVRTVPKEEFSRIWEAVMFAVDADGLPDFRINCPLLLVHGDQDTTGSIKRDMPIWYENEPHAEFHIIPDAGHNANQDNPERMNQLVIDFLARHIVIA
ncbi:MAG: alpha/beta hydrolase, partial [Chloroflexota bacterium]